MPATLGNNTCLFTRNCLTSVSGPPKEQKDERTNVFLGLLLYMLNFRTGKTGKSLPQTLLCEGDPLCRPHPHRRDKRDLPAMPPTAWSNREPPRDLSIRKARVVSDSKVEFGLILHRFKGRNHLGEKEENKATEEYQLALD